MIFFGWVLQKTWDFTWLKAQDEWAPKGTKINAEFDAVNPCPNDAAIYWGYR